VCREPGEEIMLMHCSRQRAVALFLLVLAVAMPVAALPEEGPDPDLSPGLFTVLWDRLSSLLGRFEAVLSGTSPEGATPSGTLDFGRQALDSDSRGTMDPNGGS
jgi:hypothetical protein